MLCSCWRVAAKRKEHSSVHSSVHSKMVEIKIKSLTGRSIPVDIDLNQRVSELKEVVEVKEGIPPQQQRFLFAGRQLDDDKTLAECGVVAGSDLHLVLSLRGGQ